ncbi:hypothetical protein EV178_003799 [Coemansia sp. RSA 1646]|nr:hypothetical protein EV178_003799 [Coemansia sp. RSA 1646]KAJ1764948.1 hypothetical protein LPJ74_006528 [Coemansia sp. RSA 1843]KAJ2086500.1 hypothetical protein IW138_005660 [Coemansia sp. RSA 986]
MTASAAALQSPTSTHPPPASSYSQLYPAPRTANVFSLPFARLSEPSWPCSPQNTIHSAAMASDTQEGISGTHRPYFFLHSRNNHSLTAAETSRRLLQSEEASAASSAYSAAFMATSAMGNCHAMHDTAALPSPLCTLPFWCSTSGPRKCIIYLEPRRSSPLYTAIEGFLRKSAQLIGPTEAHQYHPHSSMTGFIDISDGAGQSEDDPTVVTSGQLITKIACHVHSLVSSILDESARVQVPTVGSVATVQDYPHKGTHKVQVTLDTPDAFRNIIDAIQTAVPQARIRGKRMGHISLSYYSKHVKTDKVITTDMAQRLDALAQSFLCDPCVTESSLNQWDIAFYELAFKSTSLSVPHRLNQIARWQL